MRGKAPAIVLQSTSSGITPAYAGKRLEEAGANRWTKDHPRLCGEKFTTLLTLFIVFRITPAYAGKSVGDATFSVSSKDHPRLCGEKTKKIPKQRYFFHQPASFSFSLQYT